MTSFASLGLSANTLQAVQDLSYNTPTPVQKQAIPAILERESIVVCAETGSGKTAAFSLPSLEMIGSANNPNAPAMLIVEPTRELAFQVADVCKSIGKRTRTATLCVIGGTDIQPQIAALRKGVGALIGTPGRLLELHECGELDLDNVSILVLDEADRMLDLGFMPQVKQVASLCPSNRQTLLFSATIDQKMERHIATLSSHHRYIGVSRRGTTASKVDQIKIEIDNRSKPDLIVEVLKKYRSKRVVVFARTKRRADACCERLQERGYKAEAIHSDKSQAARLRALDNFSKGKTGILIATDVLSRGIDVSNVSCVINYDIPVQPEEYVHRIGRTGRAGESGLAITFVTPENTKQLKDIESLIGFAIPLKTMRGFDTGQSERKIVARIARNAAYKDPELAAAAKEYEAYLKKAERRKEAKSKGNGNSKPSRNTHNQKRSGSQSQPKRNGSAQGSRKQSHKSRKR